MRTKVQQKMHICKQNCGKFIFNAILFANGLHYATVLSGELLKQSFEFFYENNCLFSKAASEGTTVSLNARARPAHIQKAEPFFKNASGR